MFYFLPEHADSFSGLCHSGGSLVELCRPRGGSAWFPKYSVLKITKFGISLVVMSLYGAVILMWTEFTSVSDKETHLGVGEHELVTLF